MQEIIADEPRITEYNPLRAQLATIEADNSSLVFEYETEEGAKAARSQIHKLRLTKGALERVRKEVKKEALERGRLIDGEADEIEKRLDACIAVHEKPLKEIAQREADAKERAHKAELQRIEDARLAEERRVAQERAEQERREKNRKHRAAVNNAAVDAIARTADITPEAAKTLVVAIASGIIPNVSITY